MENMEIYNSTRAVPQEAKKEIKGGRLSGKTDINPMWRIKTLTEQFGPVGFGWRYEITDKRLEPGANGEVAAFVQINLFVKMNSQWSEPIVGIGGSAFVAKEKGGLFTSDECYKMALTDAISVACKALGMGADVYWQADRTKYDQQQQQQQQQQAAPSRKVKLFNRNDDNLVNCLCDLVTGQNLCGKNKKKEKWTLAQFETSLQGFTHEDYAWLVNRATNGIGITQNQ